MQIVTTGYKYADIDGFASVIAYSKLQNVLGLNSIPVITGPLNQSIPQMIRNLDFRYEKQIPKDLINEKKDFAIMDVSDPEQFPGFVDIDNVNTVYDHHFGYESLWKEKIGERSKIEEIGAAVTFVYEDIVKAGKINEIGSNMLLLIYTAIISNTLNLQAFVTKDRDIKAIEDIRRVGIIPNRWDEKYFSEVSKDTFSNPDRVLKGDFKNFKINDEEISIFQLELWKSKEFVDESIEIIEENLNSFNNGFKFLTSPSISENRTYFVVVDDETKDMLVDLLEIQFEGDIGVLNRLILRKEIIRKLQNL
jgi:inorganic pyrophosphatase/exopolyphosphatase